MKIKNRKVSQKSKKFPKTYRGNKIISAKDVTKEDIVQEVRETVVIGSDVEALYPSLSDVEVALIIFNAIVESGIKFQNIDFKCMGMYVAMHMTKEEAASSPLARVLPRRTARGGVRPGVRADPRKMDHWYFPAVEMTKLEETTMVGIATQIGVLTMMNTHQYSFNGKTYLQQAGGPIGLRGTCAVARVVMNVWDLRWLETLRMNNIKTKGGCRYMDDIRVFMNSLKAGWRWSDGELRYCDAWRDEDMMAGKSNEERTAEAMIASMNGVWGFLNFTMEICQQFTNKKLPTLDLMLWVTSEGVIEFEFFEKPMAYCPGCKNCSL